VVAPGALEFYPYPMTPFQGFPGAAANLANGHQLRVAFSSRLAAAPQAAAAYICLRTVTVIPRQRA